jgi:hypothetical protein
MSLWNRAPLKGVISGVSWEVDVEEIKNVPGLIEARWMNRVVNEEKVCLFFFTFLYGATTYSNAVRV